MHFGTNTIVVLLVFLTLLAGVGYVVTLLVRALKKYLASADVRTQRNADRTSLAEVLKAERLRCGMTKEFVAEALGITRQAVSKWESGASDPSTSNLLALARLYGVDARELLERVE